MIFDPENWYQKLREDIFCMCIHRFIRNHISNTELGMAIPFVEPNSHLAWKSSLLNVQVNMEMFYYSLIYLMDLN